MADATKQQAIKPCRRPDRAKKLKERKDLSETVVKCCLKKLLRSNKDSILEAIKGRVESCSKRMYLGSLIMNLLLKETFDGVPDPELANHPVPVFLDHSFIRQAMVGTDGAIDPIPSLVTVLERHPNIKTLQDSIPRHDADRNIYSSASLKLLTNIKNHLVLNLLRVMKRILYSDDFKRQLQEAELPVKETVRAMLYDLNGWKSTDDMVKLLEGVPFNIKESLSIQKAILGSEPLNKAWYKAEENKYRILRYFVYANRFFESTKDKLFNLIPITSVRSHFVTIDTHSLHGIAKEAKLVKVSGTEFVKLGQEHWGSILDYGKVIGKNKIFTGTIETDGIAVCVHFQKPKARPKNKEEVEAWEKALKEDPNVDVVGIDPGRLNIMYAVKMMEGVPKAFRLTRSHYYKASGINRAAKNTQLWSRATQHANQALSEASSKGASLPNFEKHMNVVLEHWDERWNEQLHPQWANQRLRLYGGKKRVLSTFLNKLETPGKKTVVAFGSAKFAPGGKNEVSVPTCRSFKECSYRFPTFAIDEFRTTKVFNGDKKTILEKIRRKDNGKEVRGLLWCGSRPGSTNEMNGKLINRDLNGALNIRDCFLLPKRPPMLRRVEGGGKLVQRVGHWINC